MRFPILVLLATLALPAPALAKAKPIKEARSALKEALDAAGDDKSCRRAVGDTLEDALDRLEDGGNKGIKKALALVERAQDDGEDCDKDVRGALKDARAALDDALDADESSGGDDDDGEDEAPKKKQKPRADDPDAIEAACKSNKAAACFGMAERYAGGNGVDKDESLAVEYYERACALRHMAGCHAMGNIHYEGWGGAEQSAKKSFAFQKKACDGGHGDACYSLGYLSEKGEGSEANVNKALSLYEKSCKRSSGLGCFAVGNAHSNGFAGVKINLSAAADSFERACKLQHGEACFRLAEMYRDGAGVKKSEGKEHVYYASACNAGWAEGCKRANVGKVIKEGVNELTHGMESLHSLSF